MAQVCVGQAKEQSSLTLGMTVNLEAISQKRLTDSSKSSFDTNQELIKTWRKGLLDFNHDPSSDIAEYMERFASLSLAEKDRMQWMMNSDELYEWLAQTQSCTLEIAADTPPVNLMSPISTVTALLSKTILGTRKYPVLSFFCGLRTNDSRDEEVSGTLGILRSLNTQLLEFILHNRPAIDLAFLKEKKYTQTSKQKKKSAWTLFTHLLRLLPNSDVVFILIDSFSRVSGTEEDGDKLLIRISELEEVAGNLVFKVLITDLPPNSAMRNIEHMTLQLPDNVDGGKCGVDVELLQQENSLAFQRFYDRQQNTGDTISDDGSSEGDW
jgi:hypothetical protein